MQLEVTDALTQAESDDDVRVVIITGAGRAFCAGGDLNDLGGSSDVPAPGKCTSHLGFGLGVQRCEKPVIAMVNGVATGAGLDLACACDIRIGTARSRFMSAYVRIGLFPGFGGTWLYPRTLGSLGRAAEMLFTGDFLEADEAYRLGFLNRLVDEEELESTTISMAERIAAGPPIAIRLSKLMLYKGLEFDLETAMKMAAAGETITLTSQDHVEGVTAFRQKRAAEYRDQ
ncbi:3-hydroxypropionyl-coenzyme A dehydratase [Geodia barretti]|uniref:3-hydroxypropionyl-coenzyme A dehydratase n=1 Tax=Geodia barretti TaxID=519541 RepID=A0AA35QSG3_GEOBA|nr:3-hydroxypropionyl-coenzyme A dehydratase [Geodia barretti]